MLNYLWSFMILAGLLFGAVCGNLGEVTQGLIESAQDAVALGYYYARNDDVLVRNHGDREAGGTFGMVYTENESALKFPFPGSETGSSGTRSDCS